MASGRPAPAEIPGSGACGDRYAVAVDRAADFSPAADSYVSLDAQAAEQVRQDQVPNGRGAHGLESPFIRFESTTAGQSNSTETPKTTYARETTGPRSPRSDKTVLIAGFGRCPHRCPPLCPPGDRSRGSSSRNT